MAFTLADAQQHVFRDVKKGQASPDSQVVTDQVNRAILGLLTSAYAKGEFGEWVVKVRPDRRTILLPPEIETADLISLDGLNGRNPIKVRMVWYRYLRHRCPSEELAQCAPLEADDLGDGYVTDTELDCAYRLMAYSERPAEAPAEPNDHGARVYIRGLDGDGKTIFTQEENGTVEGAYLDILKDRPRVTVYKNDVQVYFKEITHFSKPETRWPVTIAAVDFGQTDICTNQVNWTPLATAMPWETSISRRKYRLDAPLPKGYDAVHVFGRARYRPARHKTDVLLIQNLEAIRQGVLRLEAESEGDVGKIRHFDGASRGHLDEGLKRHNGNNQEPALEYGFGYTIGGGLSNL